MIVDFNDVRIIRSNRRSLALEIDNNAFLIVRAPYRLSDSIIGNFIKRKTSWISKKQKIAREIKTKQSEKKFISGENFLYLGHNYPLAIVDRSIPPLAFENCFLLARCYRSRAKEAFIKWYKNEARRIIEQRVGIYCDKLGLMHKKINISNAQKRWGSCGRNNSLNFSWRLIMAPLDVIDYVVVHEVSHLQYKNHSKKFWRLVEKLFDAYKLHKKWLRENEYLLQI